MKRPPTRRSAAYPPTIIVVHRKERRSKCTVEPLRGRADVLFCRQDDPLPALDGYVRLGLYGPLLGDHDGEKGLLLLDGTWRWVAGMEATFRALPVRTLPRVRTAYPRVSKLRADPSRGLASVEALFAAYHILGRDTTGLLDRYRWGQSFLQTNPWLK